MLFCGARGLGVAGDDAGNQLVARGRYTYLSGEFYRCQPVILGRDHVLELDVRTLVVDVSNDDCDVT